MTTSKGGVKKTKYNFKVTSKVQELEQSYVESTMIGKFSDEPKPAPMTARDVFKNFAKAKNPKITLNDLNDTWNNLAQTHKEKFTELAINNVKEYKAKLKHYVKGLPDHERRVYIGQNRVRYIRVFEGTDIFEKNYPCSEYPPFRIPGKNEKKASTNKAKQSKVNLDFDSMLKTSSSTTNGENEESGSEDQAPPNNERKFSEESFKSRLPSTSTPLTVAKNGISAAKQITVSNNNDQEESDSGSSESDDDDNSGGDNSTQYLDAVQKIHSKKLLEVNSESDSDESSESEEESPKPSHPAKAGRLPVPVQSTPKQPVTSATGGDSSSSEEETSSSSSDENARVATMNNSLNNASQQTVKASPLVVKASPHAVKASPHHSTKTAQQHLSPKKQMAPSNKTATPSSKLFQQTSKVAAQRQAESTSSDSSDSEEESPPRKKTIVMSASSRMTPSLRPPKVESSSEDEDEAVTAWT